MKCKGINLFIVFVFLFIQACSTNKQISSSVPIEIIETSEIIKNTKRAEVKFDNLRNRVKVDYNDGKSIQTVILSLRASEDENLWISASMIVPIAKVLITNERIVFYEKFQKTYINEEIDKIMRAAGIKRPVELLQNLLFGRPLSDFNKGDFLTSFLFKLKSKPAALYSALSGFALNGVNLTKLQSFPEKNSFSSFFFLCDIEGHIEEDKIKNSLKELGLHCEDMHVLGVYKADKIRKK